MTSKWPSFVTRDLGDTAEDDAEMMRRWTEYDRQMRALIASGGVHQDEDGWWVHDATGELIGPDPEIGRPRSDVELARARSFRDVFPKQTKSIERELAKRGRPPVEKPKKLVTLRLDQDVIEKFEATGKGWRSRINDVLRDAKI